MLDYRRFHEVTGELALKMESEHFEIHYGLRNPRSGKGLGPGGVGDPALVRWYLSALERLYRTMTSPPWNRPAPEAPEFGKTQVYVCDLDQIGVGDPFTAADRERVPFIALPCRSNEPLTDAAMRRAAAEAIHEGTHVFNATQRPFHRRADFHWWAWLNEAFATFMESRILPGNHDYFRFLADWIDLPGVPVNDWRGAYQACLFLHYLAGRIGSSFPNEVWMEALQEERPLQTMERLLAVKGVSLATSDPRQHDLFAHGYAMDSYFLRDHSSSCFAPELCSRFGDRAIVHSFDLAPGKVEKASDRLPHLSTHYFRCFPGRHTEVIRVGLRTKSDGGENPFRGELAVVRSDFSRGRREMLREIEVGNKGEFVVEIGGISKLEDLHHLVLVVCNCAVQDLPMDNADARGVSYEIEIGAR